MSSLSLNLLNRRDCVAKQQQQRSSSDLGLRRAAILELADALAGVAGVGGGGLLMRPNTAQDFKQSGYYRCPNQSLLSLYTHTIPRTAYSTG